MDRKGFSLVELFIVVAMIGILAVIAVPNFLAAQHSSRIARCSADLRTLATAIEAYKTHYGVYPTPRATESSFTGPSLVDRSFAGSQWVSYRFRRLTTPVAFITTVYGDPFGPTGLTGGSSGNYDSYDYWEGTALYPGSNPPPDSVASNFRGAGVTSGAMWRLAGAGPDERNTFGGSTVAQTPPSFAALGIADYDPTNGTTSLGDIVRVGGGRGPVSGGLNLPAIDRILNQYNVTIP